MSNHQTTKLDRAEFIERFVAKMLRIAGPTFDNGDSIEAYTRETAPSYFDELYQQDYLTTPSADVGYW